MQAFGRHFPTLYRLVTFAPLAIHARNTGAPARCPPIVRKRAPRDTRRAIAHDTSQRRHASAAARVSGAARQQSYAHSACTAWNLAARASALLLTAVTSIDVGSLIALSMYAA